MEGDGFIALTGEVGTGKTTLCRAFIENLDERSEVAYIFNPKLSAVELLKTVCDEFGIGLAKESTTKELIDVLNRFLLKKREEGKRVMLIVDEAQNLSREVLEQIRLLSNLETNTEKLLQIVLAGQPEMGDLLESHELRQLSQRITLNYNLSPLTQEESVQYIRHRVRIAARKDEEFFSPAAFRKIHLYSRGIPRLIHIVCDRALLITYVTNREKVTAAIVDAAIQELNPRSEAGRARALESRKTALLATLLCLIVVLLFTVQPKDSPKPAAMDSPAGHNMIAETKHPVPSAPPATQSALSEPDPPVSVPTVAPGDTVRKLPPLASYLNQTGNHGSKESALSDALTLWGKKPPFLEYQDKELIDPETYFRLTARENGFLVHQFRGSIEDISMLNLPAILELRLPTDGDDPYFMTMAGIDDNVLTFMMENGGELGVGIEDVTGLWTGRVHVPWINFFDYGGIIPISGTQEDILVLKNLLEKIGYGQLDPGPSYDIGTEKAVMEIQRKHGLPVDGLVGPLTKMVIYNELPELDIPHIRKTSTGLLTMDPKVID
jgi:general secretion pathway protein A